MTSAQAGWYDDGSGRTRYWDGANWGGYADDVAVSDARASRSPAGPPLSHVPAPVGHTAYVYHTEFLSVSEKWVLRTGSGSHSETDRIALRFTELSRQGWEFVGTTRVPVVGKVFKVDDVRTLTVAIFRRPAS